MTHVCIKWETRGSEILILVGNVKIQSRKSPSMNNGSIWMKQVYQILSRGLSECLEQNMGKLYLTFATDS